MDASEIQVWTTKTKKDSEWDLDDDRKIEIEYAYFINDIYDADLTEHRQVPGVYIHIPVTERRAVGVSLSMSTLLDMMCLIRDKTKQKNIDNYEKGYQQGYEKGLIDGTSEELDDLCCCCDDGVDDNYEGYDH